MEPKALPPAKINAIKLFNKSSLAIRPKKIDVSSLKKDNTQSDIFVIKKQVIKIKDLITTNTLLKAKEEERKRKETEKKRFAEKEEGLEKPKEEGKEKIKLPAAPKLSFLDRIKKFLFNVLLGFVVYRLIPHIPKLMEVAKIAGKALDAVTDWGGKLLNGLVTFVDWGYKAYDNTRSFLKGLGGENFTKVFDGFMGAMDKVIEASIIAMIAFGDLGGDSGRGPDVARRGKGVLGRGLGRAATRLGLKTVGRGGVRAILRLAKPLLSRAPIIGGLLEFGLSWALGDPISKALFRGIGSLLIGAVGTAIGGPVGAAIGGFVGGEVAGKLYDLLFGNKTPPPAKVQGLAQGGSITRGGKLQGPARRGVKKDTARREISITTPKLKPGNNIGGKKEIVKVFPESKKADTINPLGYTENFYEKTSDIPFFGPIFGLATKTLLGEKPSPLDYENIGKGLNSWMNNTFSGDVLRTGGSFASGGEVNAEMFMRGEDLSKVISKSVEESVSTKIDDTINDLMKQMMLKKEGDGTATRSTTEEDLPAGTGSLVGNTNAEKVFNYLIGYGFTEQAAAGVIGNLMQESGVNPQSRQLGGGPGRGIMQWGTGPGSGGRWDALVAWAESSGKDPWKLDTQVEWMMKEMRSYGTLNRLKGVTSVKRAVEIFESEMEKAGTPNYPRRYQLAADALASFGGGRAGGRGTEIELGKGYGSEGSKIAGELGRYLKKSLKQGPDFQAVTEHPEHGGVVGSHAKNSYHYSGRAIDIGAWSGEQPKILRAIAQFNQQRGVKPVELLHAGNEPSGHSDHVHVAYAKGGKVHGFTRAILGERGPEFVIDADSTAALEQNFPGFLGALNKANYNGAIQVLQNYASYEFGAQMEVMVEQPEPEIVPVMMPIPSINESYFNYSGESEPFDGVYNRG